MSKNTAVKIRGLIYRGTDVSMVGATEPTWPDPAEQAVWTPGKRHLTLGAAFNWYNFTQDAKRANEFVAEWLDRSEKRKTLAQLVRKYGRISPTMGWLCRSAVMGYQMQLGDLRKLHRELTTFASEKTQELKNQPAETVVKKPSIQDYIAEKIRECMGEIQGHYDDFLVNDCTGTPNVIASLIKFNIPQVRVKELAARLETQYNEMRAVQTGSDPQLVEGYANYGKRQINRIVDWLKTAQEQIWSYGTMKAANRKPKARKGVTPQKLVSKLKYMDKSAELKVESIDPTQILRASELWVYNVKKRKLGIYVADSTQSALYVKGSRIQGYSETLSVCKTLRKPETQIKELLAAGKPASKKWFEDIKAVESKLNGRITTEMLLIKAYK